MKHFVLELLIILGIALAAFLIISTTVPISIVDGSSMLPGLENGQRIMIIKPAYAFSSPDRGDVVIVQPPFKTSRPFVKRVIGLPGDTVEVKNGKVYLNGVPLVEPYINEAPEYVMMPLKVPADNYFVLGDNRNDSEDSHYGWTVPRENVIGEVWLRVWPLSAWGVIQGYPLDDQLQDSYPPQIKYLYGEVSCP